MSIHEIGHGQPDLIQNLWPANNLTFEAHANEDGTVGLVGKAIVVSQTVTHETFEEARRWFMAQPKTLPNGDEAERLYRLGKELIKLRNAL